MTTKSHFKTARALLEYASENRLRDDLINLLRYELTSDETREHDAFWKLPKAIINKVLRDVELKKPDYCDARSNMKYVWEWENMDEDERAIFVADAEEEEEYENQRWADLLREVHATAQENVARNNG